MSRTSVVERGTVLVSGQLREAWRLSTGIDYRDAGGCWKPAAPDVAGTFVSMEVSR